MNKYFTSILTVYLSFTPASVTAAKGEQSMLMGKPHFTLFVEANNCNAPISFNGQRISFLNGLPTNTELPVNQWIKAGENAFSMYILYGKEQKRTLNTDCNITLTLRVRQSGANSKINITLATLKYSGELAKTGTGLEKNTLAKRLNSNKQFVSDKNGDIEISNITTKKGSQNASVYTRIIKLPQIGLPKWAFFDSDNITSLKTLNIWSRMDNPTHDALVKEILPIYRKIWTALKNKEIDLIMPLYAERSKELEIAFNQAPGSLASDLKNDLQDAVNDSGRKLLPIEEDNITAYMFDNDKLVSLRQGALVEPVIAFEYKVGGAEYYDIILRKMGDRWIITR